MTVSVSGYTGWKVVNEREVPWLVGEMLQTLDFELYKSTKTHQFTFQYS